VVSNRHGCALYLGRARAVIARLEPSAAKAADRPTPSRGSGAGAVAAPPGGRLNNPPRAASKILDGNTQSLDFGFNQVQREGRDVYPTPAIIFEFHETWQGNRLSADKFGFNQL